MSKVLHQAIPAINYHRQSYASDWTNMHKAADSNYANKISQLAKSHPHLLNQADTNGCTPLHVAVLMGRRDAVKALCKAGARLNICDNQGQTPLHLGARQSRLDVVKILIENGANVNPQTAGLENQKSSPLHIAVLHNQYKIAELLLESKAKINARDELHQCPLHFAVMTGDIQFIKLLISYGADVNAFTKSNISPLSIAQARQNSLLENILRQRGAKDSYERAL